VTETRDKMVGHLVLGRYRILCLLAQGGMGTVHLARVEGAAGFSKPVVVKRMLPHLSGSAEKQAEFIREAQILSNLRHPGIVNVVDFGKQEDAHIMVLEYVHGYNLGQWLKYVIRSRAKLPWEYAVLLMLQVLSALHYAHTFTRSDGSRAGIIHRDISPGNILIDVDGNVRLADFGIARMDMDDTGQERTGDGIFKGKLPYGAPELFSGEKATPSTDLYACAVVLYQLLSGKNPFNAENASTVVRRVMTLIPQSISAKRSDVPSGLDDILARGLAKAHGERWPNAMEFATALRALLGRPEADIATEMAATIRNDFVGDMARALTLHSLEEFEETWRRANPVSNAPMLSSMPPTVQSGLGAGLPNRLEVTIPTASAVAGRVSDSGRRLVVAVIASALLAAGGATTAVLMLRAPSQASEPRFVVVEAAPNRVLPQAATAIVETLPLADGAQAGGTPSASGSASATIKPVRVDAHPRDSVSSLSRIFAQRQAAIQGCFEQNAMTVDGTPEVSIRFGVDAQGKVTSTAVQPSAVAGTALGQCLNLVARSTNFGPQEEPLVFSIPITARTRRSVGRPEESSSAIAR
jgi:serine/threonine protein kinase